MPFATAVQNAAIDAAVAAITHIALLNESLTELAGGSPAYSREAVTWGSAASGVADNTGALAFDVEGGDAVFFVGFENHVSTGDGKTLGWWPAGGHPLQLGVVEGDDETVTSKAHGLSADHRIVFMDAAGAGLPTGLTEGTVYWVRSSGLTADVFTVSATQGGSAVAITADGEVFFARLTPETFGAQGTYTIADGDLDVSGTLV